MEEGQGRPEAGKRRHRRPETGNKGGKEDGGLEEWKQVDEQRWKRRKTRRKNNFAELY